jgi:hypothetical protein
MLKKVLSIGVMAALLLVAVPPSFAQQGSKPQLGTPLPNQPPVGTGGGGGGAGSLPAIPSGISAGVAQSATQTFVSAQTAAGSAGYYTAVQVSAVATTFQDVFANMTSAGYTAQIQTWILANPSLFGATNPTTAELDSAYAVYQKSGGALTLAQWDNSILSIPIANRQAMFAAVQTYGLAYLHTQMVAALNAYAAAVQNMSRNGGIFRLAQAKTVPWLGLSLEYISIVAVSMAVVAGAAPLAIAFGAGMAIAGGIQLICGC